MREIVTVTEADIREANLQRGSYHWRQERDCPIGQVVCQRHPSWRVGSKYIRDVLTGRRIDLPIAAQEFVEAFDDEQPVQPFEFEIDV